MSHSQFPKDSPLAKSPAPAGGMASPPTDPPAASSLKTPLRGQDETNQSPSSAQPLSDEMTREAFTFGWQSRLQHDRTAASGAAAFESMEAELAQRWRSAHPERFPWEAARAIAQNAWNQVQDAVAEGSQPKS